MTSQTSAEQPIAHDRDLSRLHDDLQAEYAQLVDIVSAFDQRLLTIKGWGVTLSLASLGFGFQQNHYGLFLVAAVSGLAFWLVEATTKMHQMRYYPRMGDIEFIAYELFKVPTPSGPASSPLLDWGWYTAKLRVNRSKLPHRPPKRPDRTLNPRKPKPYRAKDKGRSEKDEGRYELPPWLFPHVMLPHVVAVVTGTILFVLGLLEVFGPI
jgi:hypothetical protein